MNKAMKLTNIILGSIVLLAFIVRFYNVGNTPPSLTWDEVAWGYNAHTIGIDGKDEFGRFLPITNLESFGDFKPPLYAYLDVIPVKLLGMTELATRLPSVLAGTLSVLLTYFLVKEIFGKKREGLALFSAFLLSLSPWHILLSRAAFEANVASCLIILGGFLFLLSVRKKSYWLVGSALAFVLSMYTFNSARVVSPILVALLGVMHVKELLKMRTKVIIAGIIGAIVFLPLFFFLLTPHAQLRFQEVNIFSDPVIINTSNQEIANDGNAKWSVLLHNRRLGYVAAYIKHYVDNLSPTFLFVKGDGNPKFSIQSVGQLYLWEIPFLVLGVLLLFRKREGKWWLVPAWLLIGIIPAGIARETPHALRIESSLPMFQILTAYGVLGALSLLPVKIRSFKAKPIFIGVMGLAIFLNSLYFMHGYFVHYNAEFSGEWQYGYKDLVKYVSEEHNKYDKVYITDTLGRPYIYFLFYSNYDQEKFRKTANIEREALGFVNVKGFDNYVFIQDVTEEMSSKGHNLYVVRPERVPVGAKIEKTFRLLNGTKVLEAYTL